MTCIKHSRWSLISFVAAPQPGQRSRPGAWPLAAVLLLLISVLASTPVWAQPAPQPRLATVQLQAGMHNIVAELAQTPAQQQLGMMMRTEMATHEGMLFVFDDVSPRCFWMKNTLLPLSIAFIEDDGTVVNIAEMKPRSEASHCSEKPVRYALEMNQGWFSKRAIKPGFRLKGPPFKP
jgi:uncharacterized membrane protein (UPF0127 family)